jgi:hypothetical protein
MRKKLALIILATLSLVGCTLGNKGYTVYDGLDTEYTKVHLYGIGCVDKSQTKLLIVGGDAAGLLLKYTDKYGDEFITTEFAFVNGVCPICKK